MKAVVTGGTGFVGSHIVRELNERGHQVTVLHRQSSKLTALEGLTYESAYGDINDLDSMRTAFQGADWVFHVAAIADYWRTDHEKMIEANVNGTRKVLQAARENGVKRVVFTSSAAALGLQKSNTLVDETVRFNLPPEQFAYGYSKSLAEDVALEAVTEGQDVVIMNPVVIIGPADLNVISGSFVIQIKRLGFLVPITLGGVAVADVRDIARWHVNAAERGRTGERYILGTENIKYPRWFKMVAQAVGVPAPFIPLPNFILPFFASMIDFLRRLNINLPIDGDQTRLGGTDIFFNFEKAWKELGDPQIDMTQSLKDTHQWYLDHGFIKEDWISRLMARFAGSERK